MNQVAHVERITPAPKPQKPDTMVSMLERVLMDASVPVERLERLLELQDRERTRLAKEAFSHAMAGAQKQMRAVLVDKANSQTRSKYASYAALDAVVRPIYTDHGFSVTFNTEAVGDRSDVLRIVAFVETAGFERRYEIEMPCDGKGAKGSDVMTRTHAVKSAVSYGKATLLPMIFNIAVTDKADDDGNGADQGKPRITEEQVMDMRDLLESTGANVKLFLSGVAKADRLEDIEAGRFDSLCAAIRRRAAERDAK